MKRGERVAAVGEQRSRSAGKEITGHRNRKPVVLSAKEGNVIFLN
jgi:hypothetical protein